MEPVEKDGQLVGATFSLGELKEQDALLRLARKALVTRIKWQLMANIPEGTEWYRPGYTMLPLIRLDALQEKVSFVVENGIPGDLCEAGVWRGGACIFMKVILDSYEVTDRNVWVCDSFQGLPEPNPDAFPHDTGSDLHRYEILKVPLIQVENGFRDFGVLDSRVRFLPGWFKDTMPNAPIERLSVLRVDGDLYESTMQVLDGLYKKISLGGLCIVDDYGAMETCRAATEDFRMKCGITEKIIWTDSSEVFWQKEKERG